MPPGHGLFTDFLCTLIIAGDLERFMFDAAVLGWGMAHDGMRMRSEWLPDTMHDVLAMLAWDECMHEGASAE